MRKLIATTLVSLDGYCDGPGGDLMALPFDPAFDLYNAELMADSDTTVAGRVTYRQYQGYWPHQGDNPNPAERAIHDHMERMEKVVVSDTLTDTAPWESTTRVVGRAEAADHLRDLKRAPGRPMVMFGSRTLRNALFEAGLVDEFHVIVGARAVGGGTPAFTPMDFRLLGVRTFDEFPSVVLRYAPA